MLIRTPNPATPIEMDDFYDSTDESERRLQSRWKMETYYSVLWFSYVTIWRVHYFIMHSQLFIETYVIYFVYVIEKLNVTYNAHVTFLWAYDFLLVFCAFVLKIKRSPLWCLWCSPGHRCSWLKTVIRQKGIKYGNLVFSSKTINFNKKILQCHRTSIFLSPSATFAVSVPFQFHYVLKIT